MSTLIAHDWIEATGGSEKVLDRIVDLLPGADLVTLWSNAPDRYPGRNVTESWLGRSPFRRSKAISLPLMPNAWKQLSEMPADRAVISSHAFAHHFKHGKNYTDVPKFVYVHSPARYLWEPSLDQRGSGAFARTGAPLLRHADRQAVDTRAAYVANSDFVRRRIARAWEVEAGVIHPPVDVERLGAVDWTESVNAEFLRTLPTQYLLGASRFVAYKRFDLVIAAGEASGLPVVLAGAGPEIETIRRSAANSSVPVTIVEQPDDALLYTLMQRALLFVFPAIEDFGIIPVEAQALGTPVLVNIDGGAREGMSPGVTGIASNFSGAQLRTDVENAAALSRSSCIQHAKAFSNDRFDEKFRTWLGEE